MPEMKAVILSICPYATIVDISHDIRKFDVRMGAFLLAQAAPYFPKGTIHAAIVDPGVGTKRRPIIIETGHGLYVGPDNGLLMLSAQREVNHVYEIANPKYMLRNVSRTFHGRDIFAPAAGHLAKGVSPSDFGPEIHDPAIPSFAELSLQEGRVQGEVIYIDGFGNIITNISLNALRKIRVEEGENLILKLKDRELTLRFCSAYGETPLNTPLAIIGSGGFLEIAVNQGSASQTFNAKIGDKVMLSPETLLSKRALKKRK